MHGNSYSPEAGPHGLLLALANTGHQPDDELATQASVRAWWAQIRPRAAAGPDGAESDLEILRAARTLIRGLGLQHNDVDPDPGLDASALAGVPLTFTLDGGPDLTVHGRTNLPRQIAACIVADLLRSPSRPDWQRVKACPGPDCAWVFVDRSRNGSRRWCQMNECGNRAKGAAFRARKRSTT